MGVSFGIVACSDLYMGHCALGKNLRQRSSTVRIRTVSTHACKKKDRTRGRGLYYMSVSCAVVRGDQFSITEAALYPLVNPLSDIFSTTF